MIFNEPVSFREADDFLHSRLDTPTWLRSREIALQWDAEARQAAFFSARVTEAAILSRLHDVCQSVMSGRMTRRQARRLLREYFLGDGADALAAMGFAPARGTTGIAQLASIPRLDLIIYQNVKMAEERGHYLQWKEVARDFPYGIWRCGNCENHRESHLARDGHAYAFDHPIWTQSPPGGEFNCHCRREIATAQDLQDLGITPDPPDSPFEPSSLGFDPSRPIGDEPAFGRTVRPEYAEKAREKCEEERARVREELERRRAEQAQLEEQAREEAERVRLEQERIAREEAERLAREEAERLAKEEAERAAREQTAREEAERQAREEAKRLAFEAEAKRQAEDAAHKAHRQAQWQKAYEKRVATWKAQCEQAIPVAQSDSKYQDYKHCVDTLVAQYTPKVAKLGKPPKLSFVNNGSKFDPKTNAIEIGTNSTWYMTDSSVRHEFGHWGHFAYFQKYPSILQDIISAGKNDWNNIKNLFKNRMSDLESYQKINPPISIDLFGKSFNSLLLEEQKIVAGFMDTIEDISNCRYGYGHREIRGYWPKLRKAIVNGLGQYKHCEAIANVRNMTMVLGESRMKTYFPKLIEVLKTMDIL